MKKCPLVFVIEITYEKNGHNVKPGIARLIGFVWCRVFVYVTVSWYFSVFLLIFSSDNFADEISEIAGKNELDYNMCLFSFFFF